MNVSKLRGKIVECGKTQKEVAEYLKISENALSSKMNGRTTFLVTEANMISEFLGLTNQEKIEIFLD